MGSRLTSYNFVRATLTALLLAHSAYAANRTWSNIGTDFNTAVNWTGGVPGTGDVALFNAARITNPNLSASLTIQQLNFSTAAASGYDLTSSSTSIKLTLTNTGTGAGAAINSDTTSGTNTIDAPIVLGAASGAQTFNQANGGTLIVNGVVSSTNTIALSLRGSGIIQLNGANTFSGGASIDTLNATLVLGDNSALGTGAFTINAASTISAGGGSRTVSNATTLGATLTIGGVNNLTLGGALTVSTSVATTLTVDNAGVTTLAGNVFISDLAGTGRTLTINGSGALTISGIIANFNGAGTAGDVKYNSTTGGTLTLLGANTYTGTTTVSSGVVNIQNATALGSTATGTTVSSGAALQLQGGITFGAEALTLDGTGISSDGALRNISGNNSWTGNITINSTTRINSDSGTLTLDVASGNAITGSADNLQFGGAGNVTVNDPIATTTGTLTKDGAGTLTLSGANSYTGITTVNGGILRPGINNGVPTGSSVVVASGGTLDNAGFTLSGTGTASLTVQNGGTLRLGGSTGFPMGYLSNTLGASSTVQYYGSSAQTVAVQSYGNLTANNASGVTLAGPMTINGNLYVQAGSFSRNDGSMFGAAVTIKGNFTADAGTTLGGEISAFTFAGTTQSITLSGVTSSQDLGQMIIGTTTTNPTVTLQTNVNSTWGLTVGTSTASTGTLNLNGKTLSVGAGNVTVNSGGTFINTTGTLNINGGFGPRTWRDNTGTQNFGAVAVAPVGGSLNLGSNILATSVSVNGGTFDLSTFTLTTPTLTQAAGTLSSGTVSASTAYALQSGTISSVLTGAASATKTGAGTVVLNGTNTYTGATTVSAGALLANNASGSATGTGAVTVTGAGALLGGNGTISGAVSMASGTNLSPGATTASGSTAILNTGTLSLSSGSNFTLDLLSTIAGTGYDQVDVTGTVGIAGSNLVVRVGAGLNIGDKFFILLNDGTDFITGTFAQGTTVTSGGDTFLINYLDNGDGGAIGNDISLTLAGVPEASTWIAGAFAVGILGWRSAATALQKQKELDGS